jgi:hypothetical protein
MQILLLMLLLLLLDSRLRLLRRLLWVLFVTSDAFQPGKRAMPGWFLL